MMDKLRFSLHTRLVDVGRRMNSIPDQSFRRELNNIRINYQEEVGQILDDYGCSMSESA